jgi:hypothetical protein
MNKYRNICGTAGRDWIFFRCIFIPSPSRETGARGGAEGDLGFADSNWRRAAASPRRIRASGNGDSGDSWREGAREGGEEERAGVWQGRRGRAEEIRRAVVGGWFAGGVLGLSPGALPHWSGAGAEERQASSQRPAASLQASSKVAHTNFSSL